MCMPGKCQSWTAELEEAENIIHQAVDDVISDSAKQFSEEQLKATSHLNSLLADALAEVRHRKGAATAAKTTKKRKRPSR